MNTVETDKLHDVITSVIMPIVLGECAEEKT